MGSGRRVLVLRAAQQASALATELERLGLEPVVVPAIEIVPPVSWAPLDEALVRLAGFDWVLFTSANAAAAVAGRLVGAWVPHVRVAAIGAATARAVERLGWRVDLVPGEAVNESLLAALLPVVVTAGRPTRFLLPRAEEAREGLPEGLRAAGAKVEVVTAYRTVLPQASVAQVRELVRGQTVDVVAFTSASTVRNLVALCEAAGVAVLPGALRVSIGPITSAALRQAGLGVDAEAGEASVGALAEAVRRVSLREASS